MRKRALLKRFEPPEDLRARIETFRKHAVRGNDLMSGEKKMMVGHRLLPTRDPDRSRKFSKVFCTHKCQMTEATL